MLEEWLTLGVELEDLQVHVGVCHDDMQLLVEGQEVGCDTLEVVFAAAEEHHFVWFFLLKMSVQETIARGYCVNNVPYIQ